MDLKVNNFAYDGEKSLFTLGSFKRRINDVRFRSILRVMIKEVVQTPYKLI